MGRYKQVTAAVRADLFAVVVQLPLLFMSHGLGEFGHFAALGFSRVHGTCLNSFIGMFGNYRFPVCQSVGDETQHQQEYRHDQSLAQVAARTGVGF